MGHLVINRLSQLIKGLPCYQVGQPAPLDRTRPLSSRLMCSRRDGSWLGILRELLVFRAERVSNINRARALVQENHKVNSNIQINRCMLHTAVHVYTIASKGDSRQNVAYESVRVEEAALDSIWRIIS